MISLPSTALRDFVARLYVPLKLRTAKPNTHRLRNVTLRHFDRFLGRPAELDDLNDLTVSAFLAARLQAGWSAHTVERDRAQLLAIWRFACHYRRPDGEPYVADWPHVEPEKLPKRIPKAWMLPELSRLFAACATMPGMIGNIRACLWWTAAVRLAWTTGERIGAIVRLRWDAIDLEGGYVTMLAETRKGGVTERLYEIDDKTIEALKAIDVDRSGLVLPWPYHEDYLWTKYSKVLDAAKLPSDRKSKFHRIRKSTASHYEAAGGNATELLGHSGRKVTLAYLDPRITRPASAAKMLPAV